MQDDTERNRAQLALAWDLIGKPGMEEEARLYFAPNYVRHSSTGTDTRDDIEDAMRNLYIAFPNLHIAIEDSLAEGSRVAWRWRSTGTHQGPYLRIPATGKEVTATGITISRFESGLIAEEWSSWDKLGVLSSLGIVPLDAR